MRIKIKYFYAKCLCYAHIIVIFTSMSMNEVAKRAGVSQGTVSRVINARGGVSLETIRTVRKAMKEVGYIPSPPEKRPGRTAVPAANGMTAESVALTPRTNTIALLVLDEPVSVLKEPIIAAAMAGIHAALNEHGLSLKIVHVPPGDPIPSDVNLDRVDGVLFTARRVRAPMRQQLVDLHAVRFLSTTADALEGVWIDHVHPDNQQIGVLAARWLLDRGHERMAYIDAMPYRTNYQERANGFCMGVESTGRIVNRCIGQPTYGDEWYPAVKDLRTWLTEAIEQFLKLTPRPTAAFIPCDRQTAMAYQMLQDRGVKIGSPDAGGELEIASCENERERLELLRHRPLSIDLNPMEMGRRAVRRLLIRLQHPDESPVRVLIPPSLPNMQMEG
jgi:DNA-binding LacI/PurR family transcriptional regulator